MADWIQISKTTNQGWVGLATGGGNFQYWSTYSTSPGATNNYSHYFADVNGDGMADWIQISKTTNQGWVGLATGGGNFQYWTTTSTYPGATNNFSHYFADVNGDGKADWIQVSTLGNQGWVGLAIGGALDRLTSVSNGIGARTDIAYKSSSDYWTSTDPNWKLPFNTYNVSMITTCDKHNGTSCLGHSAATAYDLYNGGYLNALDREFRGFSHIRTRNTVNGSTADTWYHQGNGTSPNPDNGGDSPGYSQGQIYKTENRDGTGFLNAKTLLTSAADADNVLPWFTPLQESLSTIYEQIGGSREVRSVFEYQHTNGNLTKETLYGDTSTGLDDKTVIRAYVENTTTAWILGLPIQEIVYQGIGTTTQIAKTDFYYDGVTDCNTSNQNQLPTKGNLTRIVRWLNTGTGPETRTAYDSYGNLICTRDANGNLTEIKYDPLLNTFPIELKNALGHLTKTEYYGVNYVNADNGLYGQVKSVTDLNGQITTTVYDIFGRQKRVTFPDGGWLDTSYNSFGSVGAQHVQTNTAAGLSSWVYFDGFGRTITRRSTGPAIGGAAKFILADTTYNNLGQVATTTLPYFEGSSPNGSTSFDYDNIGRQNLVTGPDGAKTLVCYSLLSTALIDVGGHMKRETKDVFGRLVQVDEFSGTYPHTNPATNCPTTYPSAYATTLYQYNVLGNLVKVTDAAGNITTIRYDSLSRKIAMSDPDMGNCGDLTVLAPASTFPWYAIPCWNYQYDSVGNLTQKWNARTTNQKIFFQYDEINRLRQKDYGTQKALGSGDVRYSYDVTPSGFTSYPLGRLSQVNDSSGTAQFGYDNMGRITRTDKVVDAVTFTTQTGFDIAGRVKWVSYPDGDVVKYDYNNPLLSIAYKDVNGDSVYTVGTDTSYMQYSGFNALGQVSTATAGNGVKTTYTYAPGNSRLSNLCTVGPGSAACGQTGAVVLQDLTYVYDGGNPGVGNITGITDARATGGLHTNQSQTFGYDALNRLTSAIAPNSYGTIAYSYDQIGNMMCNSKLSNQTTCPVSNYTYGDAAHRHAVTVAAGVNYAYDANGNMTSRGMDVLIYDYENRLVSVTNGLGTTNMIYDGDGGRVKKVKGTVTNVYIGKLFECVDPCKPGGVWAGTKHIFAGSTRIASKPITTTGDIWYYHGDHLGSTSAVTDKNGNAISEFAYLPFGDTYVASGPDLPYKYTGQQRDAETSLYFYNARYYDARLGRFTQADTIVPNGRNPQAFNRYSYVYNSPLVYTDPTGHGTWTKIRRTYKHNRQQWSQQLTRWEKWMDDNNINASRVLKKGLLDHEVYSFTSGCLYEAG